MSGHEGIALINNLVISVILHAVAKDDKQTLAKLGVNDTTLNQLLQVPSHLVGRGISPIVQLDNQSAQLHVKHCANEYRRELTIKQLIQRDAPYLFMKTNFMLDQQEYKRYRYNLGMQQPKLGRPKDPDIDNQPKELLRVLEEYILDKNKMPLDEDPETLLSFSFQYHLGIREILGILNVLRKELM